MNDAVHVGEGSALVYDAGLVQDATSSVTLDTNSSLTVNGDNVTGGYTVNSGLITLAAGSSATVNGDMNLLGGNLGITGGTFNVNIGTFTESSAGLIALNDSNSAVNAALVIQQGGVTQGLGSITGNVIDGGTLNPTGQTLTVHGNLTQNVANINLASGTTLAVVGNYAFTSGSVNLASGSNLTVSGAVAMNNTVLNIAAATFTDAGTITETGSTIYLTDPFAILATPLLQMQIDGWLQGEGTIQGTVVNYGNVTVQGMLSINGDYTQTLGGKLYMTLGDTLAISGLASLSGNFYVHNIPLPQLGDHYLGLVTYGSVSGKFDDVILSRPVVGLIVHQSFGSSSLTLDIVADDNGGGSGG